MSDYKIAVYKREGKTNENAMRGLMVKRLKVEWRINNVKVNSDRKNLYYSFLKLSGVDESPIYKC
jgi:hypothetical protein